MTDTTRVTIPRLEAGHSVHVRINEYDFHGTLVSTGQTTLSGKSDSPYTAPVPMAAPVQPDDDYIDLMMEDMPGPNGEFIEAHDASGKGVNAGQWIRNADGTASLRIPGVRLAVQELGKMRAERDEADRRAGAAERHMGELRESATARERWLETAKGRAGYHRNTSFDIVFDTLLADSNEMKQMELDFAPMMAHYGITTVRQLVEAMAARITPENAGRTQ